MQKSTNVKNFILNEILFYSGKYTYFSHKYIKAVDLLHLLHIGKHWLQKHYLGEQLFFLVISTFIVLIIFYDKLSHQCPNYGSNIQYGVTLDHTP